MSDNVARSLVLLKAGGPDWEKRLDRMTYLLPEVRERVGLDMMEWEIEQAIGFGPLPSADPPSSQVRQDSPPEPSSKAPVASREVIEVPDDGPGPSRTIHKSFEDLESLASSDQDDPAETPNKSRQDSDDEVEDVTPKSAPPDLSSSKGKERAVGDSPQTPMRPRPRPLPKKTTPKSTEFVLDSDVELPTPAEVLSRPKNAKFSQPSVHPPSVELRPGQRMLYDKELMSGTGLFSEKAYTKCKSVPPSVRSEINMTR